ncbi:MAG: putative zinc-binding metallopeptidase [Synoicihabitans sp.]
MVKRWQSCSDERLMTLRLCDLGLKTAGTPIEHRMQRLYGELEAAGLRFRPHYWLSQEWFTPDGVPGIAAPFYLAHPRLAAIERRLMLVAEGQAEAECMKILRHEAGHAIDNAYRLHRRKGWREIFGSFTEPYPESYRPRPADHNYVQHLGAWYAQAHPAEDFAETFAVWLTPGSAWRRRFKGWGALRKLEYMDELMREIGPEVAPVRTRRQVEPLREVKVTLQQHYDRKRDHYAIEWPGHYDEALRSIFTVSATTTRRPAAAVWLRHHRRDLSRVVAEATGLSAYSINQLLQIMIERSRALHLRLRVAPRATREKLLLMLTVNTMRVAHRRNLSIAL